jgi:hypothetical protein
MIQETIANLEFASSRRKECRRVLLQYIRRNIHKLSGLSVEKQKIKNGQASRISDKLLITIAKRIQNQEI